MMKSTKKVLQFIFLICLFVSFFSFALTGFLTVNRASCGFAPIIPWLFFAIFGILYGVVSGSGNRGGHDSTTWHDDHQTTHKVNLRCPLCNAINEENAKYCNQCGERL